MPQLHGTTVQLQHGLKKHAATSPWTCRAPWCAELVERQWFGRTAACLSLLRTVGAATVSTLTRASMFTKITGGCSRSLPSSCVARACGCEAAVSPLWTGAVASCSSLVWVVHDADSQVQDSSQPVQGLKGLRKHAQAHHPSAQAYK